MHTFVNAPVLVLLNLLSAKQWNIDANNGNKMSIFQIKKTEPILFFSEEIIRLNLLFYCLKVSDDKPQNHALFSKFRANSESLELVLGDNVHLF